MSIFLRRLILGLLGLLAGLAAWPAVELILSLQARFPSYLAFGAALGATVGLLVGALFGSGEGITSNVKARIPSGALAGAVMGVIGGAVGFLAGQGVFLLVANAFLDSPDGVGRWGLLGSRAVGWAILGAFVGMGEGFRAVSVRKIVIGLAGGIVGGALGGFALEYSQVFLPTAVAARLAGLVLFGLMLGVAYAVIERQMSRGVLRVLAGPLKGREFLVNQNRMRIGSGRKAEIRLSGYGKVAGVHAQLRARGRELTIRSRDEQALLVNDQPVSEHNLKYEDVLKIGSAKLYYRPE